MFYTECRTYVLYRVRAICFTQSVGHVFYTYAVLHGVWAVCFIESVGHVFYTYHAVLHRVSVGHMFHTECGPCVLYNDMPVLHRVSVGRVWSICLYTVC